MEKPLVHQGMPVPDSAAGLIEAGETVQQIQTGYHTAVSVQVKRDLTDVIRRCLDEAKLSGDLFFYSWDVWDKKLGRKVPLEGPSIDLALSAVRNFGNCAVVQRPMIETATAYVFTAGFVDLETGFTLERQFRMDKKFSVGSDKMDKYRQQDIRFQIGQSKAIRNVVLNSMPTILIDKMMTGAKESVRAGIEVRLHKLGGDIQKVIKPMLESFGRHGVVSEQLEEKIGLKIGDWGIDELVMLTGNLKALEKGTETAASLFGGEDEAESIDNGKGLSADDMKPGDADTHQGHEPANKPTEGVIQLKEPTRDITVDVKELKVPELKQIVSTAIGKMDPGILSALRQRVTKVSGTVDIGRWHREALILAVSLIRANSTEAD
ncbi:hypothetical protein KAR91_19225 [Candidatus Pacearchaeota archaeon]|nr:hypothetical protein [Candidatus Pacearchaeota archaeon]